jgi:hypothetical protein
LGVVVTPELDAKARKIYWINSMGWDGPGKRRRWPEFDKIPQKEKDYWFARAATAGTFSGELPASDRPGNSTVPFLRVNSVLMRSGA